jgi:hypothetical protein
MNMCWQCKYIAKWNNKILIISDSPIDCRNPLMLLFSIFWKCGDNVYVARKGCLGVKYSITIWTNFFANCIKCVCNVVFYKTVVNSENNLLYFLNFLNCVLN